MSKDKILYEFYYEIGDYGPKAKYQLNVEKITDKMYYGTAIRVNSKGEYLYNCGGFRIYKDDSNTVDIDSFANKPAIKVRVDIPNLHKARAVADKMARDHLRELADRLYKDDSCKPNLPVSVGDTLYKLNIEPMGCRACPHGNIATRNLCPYKCPENQFRIDEVVVDNIPTFVDMKSDGSIVLRDYYFKTRNEAEEVVLKKINERKENKLMFDRLTQ